MVLSGRRYRINRNVNENLLLSWSGWRVVRIGGELTITSLHNDSIRCENLIKQPGEHTNCRTHPQEINTCIQPLLLHLHQMESNQMDGGRGGAAPNDDDYYYYHQRRRCRSIPLNGK